MLSSMSRGPPFSNLFTNDWLLMLLYLADIFSSVNKLWLPRQPKPKPLHVSVTAVRSAGLLCCKHVYFLWGCMMCAKGQSLCVCKQVDKEVIGALATSSRWWLAPSRWGRKCLSCLSPNRPHLNYVAFCPCCVAWDNGHNSCTWTQAYLFW